MNMKMTRAFLALTATTSIAILSAACDNSGGTAAKEDPAASKAASGTTTTGNVATPPSKPQGGAYEGARGPDEGARGAAPASPTAAQPATPSPAQGYALDAIKAVPDNCSSAKVILTSAPVNADNKYAWTFTRQAMLANQQFKVVSGPPTAPGQVQFLQFEAGTKKPDGTWPARNLVAFCADGGTCNQLAAMYKAVVRSSNPQPICGQLTGLGDSSPVSIQQGDPKTDLPADSDVIGMCARLSACMIATDRSTPGDPGLECQKSPSKFKTACARKYPCSEVLACTAQ